MDLQDPILANETDPPIRSTFLHPRLDLSQYLPELFETRLRPALDRDKVSLSNLTLCDREKSSATVDGEVMVGCLGEVELGIRVLPVKSSG